jgi:integrase
VSWQKGQLGRAPAGTYFCRWRDAAGVKSYKGGFRLKSEAQAHLNEQLLLASNGTIVPEDMLFEEWVDEYLDSYEASKDRIDTMRATLEKAKRHFKGRTLRSLRTEEFRNLRKSVNGETNKWQTTQALKQIMKAAFDLGYIERDPTAGKLLKNPRPKAREQLPFQNWDEVRAIAEEMPPPYDLIPILACATGLMPQEWCVLEGQHIDVERSVVIVQQSWSDETKEPKPYGKHGAKMFRTIPLRPEVLALLQERLGLTPGEPVFPGARHGYVSVKLWREKLWVPAFKAAGIERRRPYDMRHTYATWSIRAGVNVFTLARRMGTSVDMIDRTYGHLTTDAVDHELGLLSEYDKKLGW